MWAENRPENRNKIAMDLRMIMQESEAMVCPEFHQLCRTRDEGNKRLSTDGGLSFKRKAGETRATVFQDASTNDNLNKSRR